jgi:hypothetical protein
MKYALGINLRYAEYSSKDGGYCVYSVYGEDPNCDMGGSHIAPFLGNVEGTFQEVLEYAANNMKRFYAWGGGGHIVPYTEKKENVEPIVLNKGKKLKLERKAKLKKLIQVDIDMLIENIDIMDKDSIKKSLIEIKNKL